MIVGGFSPYAPAEAYHQEIVERNREAIQKLVGKEYKEDEFVAVSESHQIVAGMVYKINIKAGDDNLRVKIFVPLPHTGEADKILDVKLFVSELGDLVLGGDPKVRNPFGGFSSFSPAQTEHKQMALRHREAINRLLCQQYKAEEFVAETFSVQLVAGQLFRITVKAREDYLGVTIFVPLPASGQFEQLQEVIERRAETHGFVGAFSGVKFAEPSHEEMALRHRAAIQEKTGRVYGDEFVAVSYSQQVVAGMIYKINLRAGDYFVHVEILEPLPGQGEERLMEATDEKIQHE